jgi:hypothetical protein
VFRNAATGLYPGILYAVYTFPPCFKTRFNIIFSSMPIRSSSKWSPSFTSISLKHVMNFRPLPLVQHTPPLPRRIRLHHPNYIWWVQIMNLHTTEFSPATCYFLPHSAVCIATLNSPWTKKINSVIDFTLHKHSLTRKSLKTVTKLSTVDSVIRCIQTNVKVRNNNK